MSEKTVTSEVFGFTANPALQPKQVIAHVGENFTTGMNFTWTTAEDAATKVILRAENSDKDITVNGSSSLGAGSKYFHNVTVNGLTPDTAYTYLSLIHIFRGAFVRLVMEDETLTDKEKREIMECGIHAVNPLVSKEGLL